MDKVPWANNGAVIFRGNSCPSRYLGSFSVLNLRNTVKSVKPPEKTLNVIRT